MKVIPSIPGVIAIIILPLALSACRHSDRTRLQPAPSGAAVHPTIINQPERLTSLESGAVDLLGKPTRIACATCHSLRESNPLPDSTAALTTFHRNLRFTHGSIVCASCHVEGHHDRLHLADGTQLPLTAAMQLCAQCHGPQYRDYQHGSHGGMTGYWDRRRGPRLRNNCVDCHDPHSPQIPQVEPVFPPRDRFLAPAPHHEEAVR